jgi:hypothetical protein
MVFTFNPIATAILVPVIVGLVTLKLMVKYAGGR